MVSKPFSASVLKWIVRLLWLMLIGFLLWPLCVWLYMIIPLFFAGDWWQHYIMGIR